ncbi:hypothetical protein ABTD81_09375 [Acinetobacter baumannii]
MEFSYKEEALKLNKNLVCKNIGANKWRVFDGDKEVSYEASSPQAAWNHAYGTLSCPFSIGDRVENLETGEIFTVQGSCFGYVNNLSNENKKFQSLKPWDYEKYKIVG